MTSTAVDAARDQLRQRRRQPEPPPWRPLAIEDLLPGYRVLAWDASLTNCAWVHLEAWDGRILIHAKGTLRPATSLTGYLGTWEKARQLDQLVLEVVHLIGPVDMAVEAPSVGGGWRVESSLMAGWIVWKSSHEVCHDVSATSVSALLLGDHQVKSDERKKLIRAAVIELIPEATGRDWNEHLRDAASVGVTRLARLARRSQEGQ